MKYNNATVRRQDRLLDETSAIALLRDGEFGVLSMISADKTAYGIPISYVWDGDSSIYVHCAPEGEKLNNIEKNSSVSFCVVGRTQVVSNKFTTAYESIILKGNAVCNLDTDERMKALVLILDKYSPMDKEVGLKYTKNSFHRTEIMRIDIKEYSGKTKRV